MPRLIGSPTCIEASGNIRKICDEYVGLVNTGDARVSITHMHSPAGWEGPARSSRFHEYAVVLSGLLRIEHAGGTMEVNASQAVHIEPGEEVILSTPLEGGSEYIAVCVPAFSRADVHFL